MYRSKDKRLMCDMERGCEEPVTHIDEKGFIYCAVHGERRKSVCNCRKLTAAELRKLESGQTLETY